MDETTDAMTQTAETPQVAPAETTPDAATQAAEATPQEPTTVETPTLSPKDRLREALKDPEIEKAYREHLNAEAQRIANKTLKRERLSHAKDDPVASLEYTQKEWESEEAEHTATTGLQTKWAGLTETVRETAASNPDWGKDYQEVVDANRKEANNLFANDPDKYQQWVDDKIYELRVDRKVTAKLKEQMPTLVEAASLDKTNQALRNVPQLPTGNGGTSDAALLASVNNMSGQEYLANKERIYAAYRRKQG